MIRIALVAGTYQPDRCGVAHYTAHLKQALARKKIDSVIITTSEAAQNIDDPGVIGAISDWHLASLPALVRAIHTTQADVLHIQHAAGTYRFNRAIFLLPLLLKLTGWKAPIVTTVHEYGWWEWHPRYFPSRLLEWLKTWGQERGWWDREDGFLLTQSHAIITTNNEANCIIDSRLPQLKNRVYQIPIGANIEAITVDRNTARQKIRQDWGWAWSALVIAFFGFLHPVKGLEILLPAFRQVLAIQPQARLLLVGGVESLALPGEQATRYWKQLQTLITELGLSGEVHMTGYLNADAASYYLSGADIGVLPFHHGVTLKSGSLLAMMAHSLPTVATRSTPPDPDLEAEHLVRQIASHNVDELAAELLTLLNDVDMRHSLGAKGEGFSRKFAWSSIADAHQEIYQSFLKQSLVTESQSTA